jgi:hypothetical protein
MDSSATCSVIAYNTEILCGNTYFKVSTFVVINFCYSAKVKVTAVWYLLMVISNGSLEVSICYMIHNKFFLVLLYYTVRCATTKDATMNECYNKHRCYNEHGGILFIMESSIIVFTRERFFMLFMCIRLFMLFIRESFFHRFH